ncbi:DNA-3-methyladenine glycosylase family protein [Saccharomonospora viridis]|jgi:3-methyladenine DNA glycosylase/8-oxoguanine DNA glycosylase|uniref:3-methyladenine DNA glycosylase n=1 Tax=Saccharomonospora viridis TaxID=1852 RepID=A0A837D907_9PSEU|nr:3-methyladenine DNA glycosylase [Saccharomonospora viridis]KHF43902.1 3-methyladenine DNA glycosylase [Saccharomonospora viridis]SFP91245.1 3-methyladenine DNA glycosylase/8-oxoguanine DNA glycosylase [Saccharomonospora viridis]
MPELSRCWRPAYPLDAVTVLSPLRRGRGDPCLRHDDGGRTWVTGNTSEGPGTLVFRVCGDGTVEARAWGDGAQVLLDGLPDLLGAADDDSGFVAHHDVVARARRRLPSLRLTSTGRVWDALVPAVLEQKVTRYEAHRSWRELCRWFGAPAPGPVPEGLRIPPTPAAILSISDWQWHRAGVDLRRRSTLVAAARVAHRLEEAVALRGERGRALLRAVPGVGVWTAAEVAQRAWGDADAVSFSDFHVPSIVGYALVGRALDDEGLAEVLAPYAPQRQRVVRYLQAMGYSRPRFAPRYPVRDYRAI